MPAKQRELTIAQERFVRELLKGKTQRQAYYVAYPRSRNWKVTTVDNSASCLFRNPLVRKRWEELKSELNKKEQAEVEWTRQNAIISLTRLIQKAEKELEQGKLTMTRIMAIQASIKELNQMHGYNQHNVHNTGAVVIFSGEDELPE